MSFMVSPGDGSMEQRVNRRLPEVYLLCALLVTVLLAFLTPPFFVPDEPNHSLRALQIAHGHMFAERVPNGAGGESDRNAYAAMSRINSITSAIAQRYPVARSRPDGRISPGDLKAIQQLTWAHADGLYSFPNTAVYPPLLYLPQAAGWAIAEHLGFTIVHSLLLARMCAALVSVLTGWLALRYTACSRPQMFLVLQLPTCLSLNASVSQDAVLFSLAALAAACLSRPLQERRTFRPGELIATGALLTVCIGARVPYLPLLLVLFLPALNMPTPAKKSFVAPAVAATCGTLLVGAWQMRVKSFGMATANGADVLKQQAFLHAHPAFGAWVVAKATVLGSSLTILKGLAWLGTNDAAPALPVYGAFALAMLLILLLSPGGCLHTWPARILLTGTAAASAAIMSLAEYLIWSAPGTGAVDGLQSRYYMPLLLLLALALPARPLLRLGPGPRRFVLAASCAVFLSCVAMTPLLASRRFYNTGLLSALEETVR